MLDSDLDDQDDDLDEMFPISIEAPSKGALVEIVRMRGDRIIDHRLLGVGDRLGDVLCVGRGRARVGMRELFEGDTLDIARDHERVIIRFAPSPAQLLGMRGARFAILALIVLAVAAAGGARVATTENPIASIERGPLRATASRRRRRIAPRKAPRIRSRVVRVRARRVRAQRRVIRRCAPSASSDGVGVQDVPGVSIEARARGPPECVDLLIHHAHHGGTP